MNDFQYKDVDVDGEKTLNVISSADKFNKWMYKTIAPFCNGNILEIGSGIGNISQYFLEDRKHIALTDIRDGYCENLKSKFQNNPSLRGVFTLDLVQPDFDAVYAQHLEKYDTVFALNVIEHIKEDDLAIANCRKLLKTEGNLIILVPAYAFLYNAFDKNLEHYRRYNNKMLNTLMLKNNFRILNSQYFNFMGIFGWYISGKLQSNDTIPQDQMSLFNFLVPLFKLMDKIVFNKMGLSVISVGKK